MLCCFLSTNLPITFIFMILKASKQANVRNKKRINSEYWIVLECVSFNYHYLDDRREIVHGPDSGHLLPFWWILSLLSNRIKANRTIVWSWFSWTLMSQTVLSFFYLSNAFKIFVFDFFRFSFFLNKGFPGKFWLFFNYATCFSEGDPFKICEQKFT